MHPRYIYTSEICAVLISEGSKSEVKLYITSCANPNYEAGSFVLLTSSGNPAVFTSIHPVSGSIVKQSRHP